MLLFMKPVVVELSDLIGVGSWGWPKHSKVHLIGKVICAFVKKPAVSDSATEATTLRNILQMTRMGESRIGYSCVDGVEDR